METEILIYGESDLKKSGGFKKNFSLNWITKEEFFKYLKENDLSINSNYIDITGNILNKNLKFRCSYAGLIVGVSGIVKEFNKQNESKKEL